MNNNILKKRFSGMLGFTIVSFGQLVSLLGSAMTRFALVFWAYQLTGKATALALMSFFAMAPRLILSPIAGVLVDRYPRKAVMILTDLATGVCMVIVYLLYSANLLEIWHLYALTAVASAFQALQFPAYSAAITMMVSKEQYARANGILSTARSGSTIIAPPLAAIFLRLLGIGGIIAIEIITLIIAISLLFLVIIPEPNKAKEQPQGNLLQQSAFGFKYILQRKSLLGLQITFSIVNLTVTFATILITAYVLAKTGNNELILGSVQSAAGIGGLVGGFFMSTWGGPKNKINGVFGALILQGMLAYSFIAIGTTPIMWMIGIFTITFTAIIANACSQDIWQRKVPPECQGRVFATRILIAQITGPIAMLIAGPLADNVFEPAMTSGGNLAKIFGPLVGTSSGSGFALIIFLAGITLFLAASLAYLLPSVRKVDSLIADHDTSMQYVKGAS